MKEYKTFSYSVAIRTLGRAGEKYQTLLSSLLAQTIKPEQICVYIAEGYPVPKETIGVERYIYVKKGMVSQRAVKYDEITSDYILFLDDDVYLPEDAVEKLFDALCSYKADVISPDVFNNANRPQSSKLMMAVSGRMIPRRDDNIWAYRVMKNAGYSYNVSPSQSVYYSQTNAGPCFLCSKENFLKISYQDERWLEECDYAQGDDQVMFYKMTCLGLKQLTIFDSGIVHLDAGTALQSKEKEKSLIYADFRFKTIFWHRYIYMLEKKWLWKLWSCLALCYTFVFAVLVSLFKFRIDIARVKITAIRDGVRYIHSDKYKTLPLICYLK